jgi:predicted XRE-type DNA-binding protein
MTTVKTSAGVRESGGNVFADLGLRDPQGRLIKADLAHRICQLITARRLTQARAAKMMGLDQPKISALRQGRLKGFSAERLFRCLNDLGQEIEITIRPVKRAGSRGEIRVVAEGA